MAAAEVLAGFGNPLCVGELRSPRADAPTVLIYGHYDVQSPDPVEQWTSDPFEPVVRDDRLYARGASDDKGNFLPLLHVACELARSGDLPGTRARHPRGRGGDRRAQRPALSRRGRAWRRRAIVFDGGMIDEQRPALHIAARGIVMAHVHVRTAERTLHSGVYGGAALNAAHALAQMLAAVLPGPDGRLRPELRAGVKQPSPEEVASWAELPAGAAVLAAAGATEIARAPPPSSTTAHGPTPASTSTGSRAAIPCSAARSCREPRACG